MPKKTTAAIYQPLTPGGLFIIHKKLFQNSGNPVRARATSVPRWRGRVLAPEKITKNGNLLATLAPPDNRKLS
jgi:hypothetical protein